MISTGAVPVCLISFLCPSPVLHRKGSGFHLHFVGPEVSWLLAGFCQWEAQADHRRAGKGEANCPHAVPQTVSRSGNVSSECVAPNPSGWAWCGSRILPTSLLHPRTSSVPPATVWSPVSGLHHHLPCGFSTLPFMSVPYVTRSRGYISSGLYT